MQRASAGSLRAVVASCARSFLLTMSEFAQQRQADSERVMCTSMRALSLSQYPRDDFTRFPLPCLAVARGEQLGGGDKGRDKIGKPTVCRQWGSLQGSRRVFRRLALMAMWLVRSGGGAERQEAGGEEAGRPAWDGGRFCRYHQGPERHGGWRRGVWAEGGRSLKGGASKAVHSQVTDLQRVTQTSLSQPASSLGTLWWVAERPGVRQASKAGRDRRH